MNQLPKEGAGRPLYTSAPVLPAKQPETEGKPPSFWQSLPRRRVFLAAAAASYLYGYYYVQRSLPGLNADWSARVFWPLFAAAFLLGVSAFAQALGRAGSRNVSGPFAGWRRARRSRFGTRTAATGISGRCWPGT